MFSDTHGILSTLVSSLNIKRIPPDSHHEESEADLPMLGRCCAGVDLPQSRYTGLGSSGATVSKKMTVFIVRRATVEQSGW